MPKTNDPEQWQAKKGLRKKENNRQIMTIFWHLNMTNNKLERRVDPWQRVQRKSVIYHAMKFALFDSFGGVFDGIRIWVCRYPRVFQIDRHPLHHYGSLTNPGLDSSNHISKSHVHMRVRFVGGPQKSLV